MMIARSWKDFQLAGYRTMVSFRSTLGYRAEIADKHNNALVGHSTISEDDAKDKALHAANQQWPVPHRSPTNAP